MTKPTTNIAAPELSSKPVSIYTDADAHGRPLGYSLNGVRQSTHSYDTATGRLASMLADGSDTPFTWSYLPGSELKSQLTYPNGMTASWEYDACDRLTQVRNATASTISQYDYTYDIAGRRVSCAKSGAAMSESRTDTYGYNARSELISAAKTGGSPSPATEHEYAYDPIGNRQSSADLGESRTYTANNLNQYTGISDGVDTFAPQFDDDGDQTLIQTKTGIWSVTYNGENRPVSWSCGETNVVMSFDRMGRRVEYTETVGTVTNAHRTLVYDNYLQIANSEYTTSNSHLFVWDPTEPVATRPLVFITSTPNAQPATHFYTHDGNKNVSGLIDDSGSVTSHYEYAPFGDVEFSSGSLAFSNPFRFSSEYADDALGLVYYNYRHYEPVTGRWMSHDPVEFLKLMNNYPPSNVMGFTILLDTFILDYNYLFNSPLHTSDYLGLYKVKKCFIDIFLGHNTKTDKQEFAYVPKQIETGSCGAASAHTCYSDNIKIYVNRIAQGVSGAISISKGVADADRAFQQAENQWATKLCNASDENGNSCCCKKISISIKCQFGLDIMSRAAVSKGICGKHVDVICGEK